MYIKSPKMLFYNLWDVCTVMRKILPFACLAVNCSFAVWLCVFVFGGFGAGQCEVKGPALACSPACPSQTVAPAIYVCDSFMLPVA